MEEIERIKATLISQIKPGDTVVLRSQEILSREAIDRLRKTFKGFWPDNRIIVLEAGMSMEIYREKTDDDQI